jgi:hypothetical protein
MIIIIIFFSLTYYRVYLELIFRNPAFSLEGATLGSSLVFVLYCLNYTTIIFLFMFTGDLLEFMVAVLLF